MQKQKYYIKLSHEFLSLSKYYLYKVIWEFFILILLDVVADSTISGTQKLKEFHAYLKFYRFIKIN